MSALGNLIEELCTATNLDITLAGAKTGGGLRAAYEDKFADGATCEYALFDEDGTKVAQGVGVFQAGAPAKILRPAGTDRFTLEAGSYVENATSNLTFSGGNHTVRCEASESYFKDAGVISGSMYAPDTGQEINAALIVNANVITYAPIIIKESGLYDAFKIEITSGGTNARFALHDPKDGLPFNRKAVHNTSFDVSSTGDTEITFDEGSIFIYSGEYYIAMFGDADFSVRATQTDSVSHGFMGASSPDSPYTEITKALTYTTLPDPANIASHVLVSGRAIMAGVVAT